MATAGRGQGLQTSPHAPSPATTPLDEYVKQLLRTEGGRVTLARLLVLRVLTEAEGHLGAQEIHTRVSALAASVTLSTVYRALSRLEELGLVHALPTAGETQYGIADEPHHHAICTGCGKVTELPDAALTETLKALERATGYTFTLQSSLTMRALCRECQDGRRETTGPS